MKLTIDRAALLKALGHVQSVVERRNTIPILSNIKLESRATELHLSATDMDLEVLEMVGATVGAPGAATVPAHTLYDIVRKLPDGSEVKLDATGGDRLTLVCGRSRFTLSCLPVEDFPLMAGGDLGHQFRLAATSLRSLIDRTRFAISTEETRYYLNGIYLHAAVRDGVDVLRAVATDGHRLACVEVPLPPGASGMPGVIIPRKTVGEVRKLVEDADGELEISLSATKIRFSVGSAVLTSKLIDGTFPDYERVIPTGNEKAAVFATRPFAEAVDRVATISTEKARAVKLSFDDGTVTISAVSAETGRAVEELDVEYSGEPLEIGFNARYILDMLQEIDGEKVRFEMASAAAPTVARDPEDMSTLYVLMPMRV